MPSEIQRRERSLIDLFFVGLTFFLQMNPVPEIEAALPWFFSVTSLVLGACVGSFLNVVILRVPLGKSIVRPSSTCQCGQPIAWRNNVPILGWLLLRGRARCCGHQISLRYPLVELLTAVLFLACVCAFPPLKALVGMAFLSLLVCAAFIDLDHMIIPDSITIGGGVLGVLLSLLVPALHGHHGGLIPLDMLRSSLDGLLGLFVGSGLILWLSLVAEALLRKEAMGFGDVKLLGMIGAFCGWEGAVFALFGGAVIGTLWCLAAWVCQRVRGHPSTFAPPSTTPDGEPTTLGFGAQVPFGPMLTIAAGIYFLALQPTVATYIGQLRALF